MEIRSRYKTSEVAFEHIAIINNDAVDYKAFLYESVDAALAVATELADGACVVVTVEP